jgi:K+ transporter
LDELRFHFVEPGSRVDPHNGKAGTLALIALAHRAVGIRGAGTVILLGIISGALFYGDAIITPALSVLPPARSSSRAGRGA